MKNEENLIDNTDHPHGPVRMTGMQVVRNWLIMLGGFAAIGYGANWLLT